MFGLEVDRTQWIAFYGFMYLTLSSQSWQEPQGIVSMYHLVFSMIMKANAIRSTSIRLVIHVDT
jgi:hypothetical protein